MFSDCKYKQILSILLILSKKLLVLSENFVNLHFKISCHEITSWNVAC